MTEQEDMIEPEDTPDRRAEKNSAGFAAGASTMRLRIVTHLTLFVFFVLMCLAAVYALHARLLPRIEKDEVRAVRAAAHIVADQLDAQLQVARTKLESLGLWDEAHEYTSDPFKHKKIEEVLLSDASLATADYGLVTWLDKDGKIIYGRKRDPDTGVYGPIPQGIIQSILPPSPLFPDAETRVLGFTLISNRPGMVASQPVAPHTYHAPSSGRVIGWFLINDEVVAELSKISGVQFKLTSGTLRQEEPEQSPKAEPRPGLWQRLWQNMEGPSKEEHGDISYVLRSSGPAYAITLRGKDVQRPGHYAFELDGVMRFPAGESALEIRNFWLKTALVLPAVLFVLLALLAEFFFIRPFSISKQRLRAVVSAALSGKGADHVVFAGPSPFRELEGEINNILHLASAETEKHSEVQQNSQAKSEFLSAVSHEIRGQLNIINGFVYLLSQHDIAAAEKAYLGKIGSAADRLLHIISDIMDYSRLDTGTMVLEFSPFALDDVLSALAAKYRGPCLEKGLELIFGIPPDIPQNLVGDSARLQQMLGNLLGNALKYTQQGEIFVGCSVEQRQRDQVCLNFIIRDSGVGMEQEQLDNLFDAFRQSIDSDQRRYGEEGTGMGLAITRQLAQLMGGDAKVRSIAGRGTKVSVSCCFGIDSTKPARIYPEAWRSLRLLVVDDNYSNRMALYDMLTSMGFETDLAEGGLQGLESVMLAQNAGKAYSVVILDQVMDDLNGLEVCKKLHEDPAIKPKPAVILTSAFNPPTPQAMEAAHISSFLAKPVNCSLLLDAINMVMAAENRGNNLAHFSIAEAAPRRPHFPDSRVLLVEDNPVNEQIALELLSEVGIKADVAHTGREAVDKIQAVDIAQTRHNMPYDLVFMDIQMPEMDGITATRILRKNPLYNKMPIVAMTAHALQEDRDGCLAAGMNEHLSKPVELDKFYAVLRQFLIDKSAPEVKKPEAPIREEQAEEAGESFVFRNKSSLFGECVEYDAPARQQTLSMLATLSALEGFDSQTAMQTLNYDKQLYAGILRRFWEQYGCEAPEIEKAFTAGKLHDIVMAAHNIRAIAGSMGHKSLQFSAISLEQAGRGLEAKGKTSFDPLKNEEFTALYTIFISNLKRALTTLDKVFKVQETL